MELLHQDKVSAEFKAKIIWITNQLEVPEPSWLMAFINFESGGTFSPSITNSIGCVGLIQFCPDFPGGDYKTIAGERVTMKQLASMTAVQQLDWVYKYLRQYKSKIVSYVDLYLAILFPLAMAKPDGFVIESPDTSAASFARSNPAFDYQGKGYATVGDVKTVMLAKLPQSISAVFRRSADSIGKYVHRNWLGVGITILAVGGLMAYLIYNRKQIIQ